MPKAKNISSHVRHLLMSVTLLWALMLNGQEVVAYTSANGAAQQTSTELTSAPDAENKTLVKQKVSLVGTTSFVALNLQQAMEPLPQQPAFAFPASALLPAAYTAVPPGAGFAARILPTTLQPNAP
ncbi:RNA methyltransferase [Pontibacter anaerobius]|uniref:RNA methyltransferase n=1 Tax=Pontibacter anaerobius TaxID=2993940 RepID=A0ABT3RB41_9BACT|nr:RNA methyltransferase [Pontibacter anaerobius]MCX2738592.1 RNA methyltransferase [Pontibacter anaerobius]